MVALRSLAVLVVLVAATLAARRTEAQERHTLVLPAAAVDALRAERAAIDATARLRLRTWAGTAVLISPTLTETGLAYHASRGRAPAEIGIGTLPFAVERQGRATVTGMAVGATVLGVLGALLGAAVAGMACIDYEGPGQCSPNRAYPAALLGVVGAAAGGLIGAGIGSLITRWRPLYRSPSY